MNNRREDAEDGERDEERAERADCDAAAKIETVVMMSQPHGSMIAVSPPYSSKVP